MWSAMYVTKFISIVIFIELAHRLSATWRLCHVAVTCVFDSFTQMHIQRLVKVLSYGPWVVLHRFEKPKHNTNPSDVTSNSFLFRVVQQHIMFDSRRNSNAQHFKTETHRHVRLCLVLPCMPSIHFALSYSSTLAELRREHSVGLQTVCFRTYRRSVHLSHWMDSEFCKEFNVKSRNQRKMWTKAK